MINDQIGIFWLYENKCYIKTQKLENIQTINGYKDSDLSHYKEWDSIKLQNSKFYIYEYEEIPRGRVVYDCEQDQFIIYANKNLINPLNQQLVCDAFNLEIKKSVMLEDEHYLIK